MRHSSLSITKSISTFGRHRQGHSLCQSVSMSPPHRSSDTIYITHTHTHTHTHTYIHTHPSACTSRLTCLPASPSFALVSRPQNILLHSTSPHGIPPSVELIKHEGAKRTELLQHQVVNSVATSLLTTAISSTICSSDRQTRLPWPLPCVF